MGENVIWYAWVLMCASRAMSGPQVTKGTDYTMTQALQAFLDAYHSGTAIRAYEFLGCHPESRGGQAGFVFRVWAPNAKAICVTGDFNGWSRDALPMEKHIHGVWEAWSSGAYEGCAYKYLVCDQSGSTIYKADPVGFRSCRAPDTSSMIFLPGGYEWQDAAWMASKEKTLNAPVNIYEMHLGSWRRKAGGEVYSYSELAPILADYLKDMGYTHVELLPLCEYPYDPSWGYQATGYFAPTSRYGAPDELMELVDTLHQNGIGVILDWVPAHFPKDAYGLYEFDGTCTYESSDPTRNEHPEWTTRIFDLGKPEVRSFLISSAVYWLEQFHVDGLRVDAVSAMLYQDFGRSADHTCREETVAFLRQLNAACFRVRENVMMIAEESTAFPLVTKPDYDGGLGFLYKWNMGWMNDTLRYMKLDPLYRKYNHNMLTFSMTYAFSENFILPLSHDEVVHCKGSLLTKMPGDYFWRFSNLRLLRGYQMAHPGKKLHFMGGEFGQFIEWNYLQELDWVLLDFDMHSKTQAFFRDLNRFYKMHPALWADDGSWGGFQWLQPDDSDSSLIAFCRMAPEGEKLIVLCNFTPVRRKDYLLGLPQPGVYECLLCSDDARYGGTGHVPRAVSTQDTPFREFGCSALFDVPSMSISFFTKKPDRKQM